MSLDRPLFLRAILSYLLRFFGLVFWEYYSSGTIADTIGFGGSIGAGIDYFKDMDNYKGRADTAEVCAIAACARIHINPQTKETIGWGISPLTEVGGGLTFYKGDTNLYHNPISIKKDKGKK